MTDQGNMLNVHWRESPSGVSCGQKLIRLHSTTPITHQDPMTHRYLLFECVIETERDNLLGVGTLEEMAQLVPISNQMCCNTSCCNTSCVLDIFQRDGQYQTEHYIYTVIPWTDGPVRSGPTPYVKAIDHGLHGHYLLLHEHHDGGGGGGGLDFWEYETQTEAEQKFLEVEDATSVVMWGITAC